MIRTYNKDGPDFDVGYCASRRPRDGTGRKARDETTWNARDGTNMPRDGTGGNPRDGTGGMPRDGTPGRPRDWTNGQPRDGTFRKPRGEIIPVRGSPGRRYKFILMTGLPKTPQSRGKPNFRWRKPFPDEPAIGPVMGEVRPVGVDFFREMFGVNTSDERRRTKSNDERRMTMEMTNEGARQKAQGIRQKAQGTRQLGLDTWDLRLDSLHPSLFTLHQSPIRQKVN